MKHNDHIVTIRTDCVFTYVLNVYYTFKWKVSLKHEEYKHEEN